MGICRIVIRLQTQPWPQHSHSKAGRCENPTLPLALVVRETTEKDDSGKQLTEEREEEMNSKIRRIGFRGACLGLFLFTLSSPALATIVTIKGTLTCSIGCSRTVVQFIAQGENHSFEVVGQFVDLSTGVQISGSRVTVSYGTRKGGANSSIIVNFSVQGNAAPGERTVTMNYANGGTDTFKVRVVSKGSISQVQYRRPLPFRLGGGAATELVPATNLPLNQTVLLIVTGTNLANIELRPETTYPNVSVRAGGTGTSRTIEIEFTGPGQGPLSIFDAALSGLDMRSSGSSKFSYTGGTNRNIQYGGTQSGGSTFVGPVLSGVSGSPNTFVDVAPRANMLNVFRRTSQNPAFTENGVQYFPIEAQHCNGMALGQSRVITVANPLWGVSNVGTAGIATAFAAELRSGNQVLATQTITSLSPGQTRDFTVTRQDSRVRVFTFLTRGGCFVAPTASNFFEDPPFSVVVNTNGALTEATANQSNNSRNY
jgi:hypothetical protein